LRCRAFCGSIPAGGRIALPRSVRSRRKPCRRARRCH
jgi:hypothetical protein